MVRIYGWKITYKLDIKLLLISLKAIKLTHTKMGSATMYVMKESSGITTVIITLLL